MGVGMLVSWDGRTRGIVLLTSVCEPDVALVARSGPPRCLASAVSRSYSDKSQFAPSQSQQEGVPVPHVSHPSE